jgi:hypothetical protein
LHLDSFLALRVGAEMQTLFLHLRLIQFSAAVLLDLLLVVEEFIVDFVRNLVGHGKYPKKQNSRSI